MELDYKMLLGSVMLNREREWENIKEKCMGKY